MINFYFIRYKRLHFILKNVFNSKFSLFKKVPYFLVFLNDIIASAGLYSRKSLLIGEFSLMLSNLTARPSRVNYRILHGKKKIRTVLLHAVAAKRRAWLLFDKFLWEFIPAMYDFITPKSRKHTTNSYTIRFRQSLSFVEDFNEIIELSMYETHRGIYLPITLHFKFNQIVSAFFVETYLRMLGMPSILYKRKQRPAFDDAVVFTTVETE